MECTSCPPRMADGRLFTDYRPRGDTAMQFRRDSMVGSYTYRQQMIRGAEKLMIQQRTGAYGRACCGPCKKPYHDGTMLPEADKFVCDAHSCKRLSATPGGLGTGRSF